MKKTVGIFRHANSCKVYNTAKQMSNMASAISHTLHPMLSTMAIYWLRPCDLLQIKKGYDKSVGS